MDVLNFYNEEDNKELKEKIGEIRELQRIDEEVHEEDVAIQIMGGKKSFSHEAQKKHIFDTIQNMTSSIQGFSLDIESRLGKAYKGGADKKFGISEMESARS